MSYIETSFIEVSSEVSEMLIALLSDLQYEGFEEEENGLKAFITKELFDEAQLQKLSAQFKINYTVTNLPDTNWNEVWESNFQPIVVGNWVLRAEFHQPEKDIPNEIIITPKMSFGTGHHATTFMMVQQMQEINFTGKGVLDFGTGTGVLAILAAKLGAASVLAIDNDILSIDNATENFKKNNIDAIDLKMADHIPKNMRFNIILANLTRNVIIENFIAINECVESGGVVFLSGLLIEDEKDIVLIAAKYKLVLDNKLQRDNWICLKLIKQ